MAKQRHKPGDDRDPAPAEFEVDPAEATPAGGVASVEGGAPEGTPAYPPPASDLSGERTANVPPTKQLPTKAPEEAGPDAPEVPSVATSIEAVDAELARLRAENADYRTRLGLDRPAEPVAGGKRFRVTAPGLGELTVDAADEGGAVDAYQRHHGVWSLPARPSVAPAE